MRHQSENKVDENWTTDLNGHAVTPNTETLVLIMKRSHILPTLLLLSNNKSPRSEKSLLLLFAALFSKWELKFHSFSRWPLRAGVSFVRLHSRLLLSSTTPFSFCILGFAGLLTLQFKTKDKSFRYSQEPAQTIAMEGTVTHCYLHFVWDFSGCTQLHNRPLLHGSNVETKRLLIFACCFICGQCHLSRCGCTAEHNDCWITGTLTGSNRNK